jgi:hypothetical protein
VAGAGQGVERFPQIRLIINWRGLSGLHNVICTDSSAFSTDLEGRQRADLNGALADQGWL